MRDYSDKKKENILKFLKKNKRASTFRIEEYIKASHPRALEFLKTLANENKIIMQKETLATYWMLTKTKKPVVQNGKST